MTEADPEVLNYGAIVAIKEAGNNKIFLSGDGYANSDLVAVNIDKMSSTLFNQTHFMILPDFFYEKKIKVYEARREMNPLSFYDKEKKCEEIEEEIYKEYKRNYDLSKQSATDEVKYDTRIQLLHINSNKFLAYSGDESKGLKLVEVQGPKTVFLIQNIFKYQREGNFSVPFKNSVKLCYSGDLKENHPALYIGKGDGDSTIFDVSLNRLKFTHLNLFLCSQGFDTDNRYLRGGDIIWLRQLDNNIIFSASSNARMEGISEQKKIGKNISFDNSGQIELAHISDSSETECLATKGMWVIENLDKTDPSPIKWESKFRLFSISTRKYLSLEIIKKEGFRVQFTELPTDDSIFKFDSLKSGGEIRVKRNEFITLIHDSDNLILKVVSTKKSCELKLDKIISGENTFKLSKCQDNEIKIAFLDTSSSEFLKKSIKQLQISFLQHKEEVSYADTELLYEIGQLIEKLTSFLSNQALFSKFNEKYGDLNPSRQKFLAGQDYIRLLSLVLRYLFHWDELNQLNEMMHNNTILQNPDLEHSQNNSFSYDEGSELNTSRVKGGGKRQLKKVFYMLNKDNVRSKSGSDAYRKKIATSIKTEFLRGKVHLADEIYRLLLDICTGFKDHQDTAFSHLNFLAEHFILIDSARILMAYFIQVNQDIAHTLEKDFNLHKLLNRITGGSKRIIDIVIVDEGKQLTTKFDKIQQKITQERTIKKEDYKMTNLLLYCSMILVNAPLSMRLKVIDFFIQICEPLTESTSTIQDLLRKLLDIPSIFKSIFQPIICHGNMLQVKDDNGNPTAVDLGGDLETTWFYKQLRLCSNLSKGRNPSWMIYMKKTFRSDSLASVIWDERYNRFKAPLFSLLKNLYIDQEPLQEVFYPQTVQVIANNANRADYRWNTFLKIQLSKNNRLEKKIFKPLIESLESKIADASGRLRDDIGKLVDSANILIDINEKLEYFGGALELIDTLIQFGVYNIFEEEKSFRSLTHSCLVIIEFSTRYPSLFPCLSKLNHRSNTSVIKKGIRQIILSSQVPEDEILIQSSLGMDSKGFEHPIFHNFFYIKSFLKRMMHRSTRIQYPRHKQLKFQVIDIFNRMYQRRQDFLIDNFCCWVKKLGESYVGKKYSTSIELEILKKITNDLPKLIPEVMKTGIESFDDEIRAKNKFTRFVDHDVHEIYDFDYLMFNQPSTIIQSKLKEYGSLLPNIICLVMSSGSPEEEIKFIDFLLLCFNQRKSMISHLETTILLDSEESINLYNKTNEMHQDIDKITSKMRLWRKDTSIIVTKELEDSIKILRGIEKQFKTNKSIDGQSNTRFQDLFFEFRCHIKILDLIKDGIKAYIMITQSTKKKEDREIDVLEDSDSQMDQFPKDGLFMDLLRACCKIIVAFVKDSSKYKSCICGYSSDLLHHSEIDVGQTDIFIEIFSVRSADFEKKAAVLKKFYNLIISEGRQERFLKLFETFAGDKAHIQSDSRDIQIYMLNLLFPYSIDADDENSYFVLFRSRNEDLNLLNSSHFGIFIERIVGGDSITMSYKDQPFYYHKKLLNIVLEFLSSKVKDKARPRIIRYYSFEYLLRLLESDKIEFFEDPISDLSIITNIDDLFKSGVHFIRSTLAAVLYELYISGESEPNLIHMRSNKLFYPFLKSINQRLENLRNISSRRVIHKDNQTYIVSLLEIITRVFEKCKASDSQLNEINGEITNELIRFYELMVDIFKRFLTETSLTDLIMNKWKNNLKNLKPSSLKLLLITKILQDEARIPIYADQIKTEITIEATDESIDTIEYHHIWKMAMHKIYDSKQELVEEENAYLAKSILRFSSIFKNPEAPNMKIEFNIMDLLTKLIGYLSNANVRDQSKIQMIELIMTMLRKTIQKVKTQSLFNSLSLTECCFVIFKDTDVNSIDLLSMNVQLLVMMLEGGNRAIQRAVHTLFSENYNLTEGVFKKFDDVLRRFREVVNLEENIDAPFVVGLRKLSFEIMKLIQLLCENHFSELQELFREQPHSRNSYNIMESINLLMMALVERPMQKIYRPLCQSLQTLIELVQGPCRENQMSIIQGSSYLCINEIIGWGISERMKKSKKRKRGRTKLTKSTSVLKRLMTANKLKEKVSCVYSLTEIDTNYQEKEELSEWQRNMIIYNAIALVNAMMELQNDKTQLIKIKKDIDEEKLMVLLENVYVNFCYYNKKVFRRKLLNRYDTYQGYTEPKNEGESLIIEIGFFCYFLLVKLYENAESSNEGSQIIEMIRKTKEKVGKKTHFRNYNLTEKEIDFLNKERNHDNYEHRLTNIGAKSKLAACYYYEFYSSKIEIVRQDCIEEVFFIKHPYTMDLEGDEKDTFNHEVNRSTTSVKVRALLDSFDRFNTSMIFQYNLRSKNSFISAFFMHEELYKSMSFGYVILMNIIVLLSFSTKYPGDVSHRLNDTSLLGLDTVKTKKILYYGGIPLIVFGIRFLLFHYMKDFFFYKKKHWTSVEKVGLIKIFGEWLANFARINVHILLQPIVIYYIIYAVLAVLGVFIHPFFYAPLCLELLNKFKSLRNFLRAITDPWKQLMYTLILFLIIEYIFSLIAFLKFYMYFDTNGKMCQDLFICFLMVVDMTMKFQGGVGSYMDSFDERAFLIDHSRTVYDWSFNFILIVVAMNIVSGIIVDTFGQLRDDEMEKIEDKHSNCFICGIPKEEFDDVKNKSFIDHIDQSHNMWDYIYYLCYVMEKDPSNHTGEESFVYDCFKESRITWVPFKRCKEMNLDNADEEDKEFINFANSTIYKLDGLLQINMNRKRELESIIKQKKKNKRET